MRPEDDAPLEPYREAIRRYGAGFEALLWNSVASQEARFAQLALEVDLTTGVLADMGCGRADLVGYLDREGVARGAYIGVEAIAQLAETARSQLQVSGVTDASIIEADFAGDRGLIGRLVRTRGVRTVYFSGSLNTFDPAIALEILGEAWEAIADAPGGTLVFNFLSSSRPASDRDRPARRWDTPSMLSWALDRTPFVVFRQGYLADNDATIVMRSPRAPEPDGA